jgi:putative oxidoreductase
MLQRLNRGQAWGSLALRLALALSVIYHGYQKVVPHNALHHFTHYIAALGLPGWLGYVSAITELVGGILILFGLFTRVAAIFLTVNMLVALFAVAIHQGYDGYSYVAALAGIAIMLIFTGGGALSLDRKFGFS